MPAADSAPTDTRPSDDAPRRSPLVLVIVLSIVGLLAFGYFAQRGAWFAAKLEPLPLRAAIARMNEGIGLLERYDYTKARPIFSELAEMFPEWTAAHVNEGLAALNLQDEAGCRAAFGRVLELDPQNGHALLSLGIFEQFLSHFESARDYFARAVATDPSDPHALFYLGAIHAELGENEPAELYLRKALHLQPSFASAWFRLAGLRRTRETLDERRELMAEFSRLKDQNVAILTGNKYGEGGRYNLAIRDSAPPGFQETVRESGDSGPPQPPSLIAKGVIHDRLGGARREGERPLAPGMALGDLDGDGRLELVVCRTLDAAGGSATSVFSVDDQGAWSLRRRLSIDADLCALGDVDGDLDLDLVTVTSDGLWLLPGDGGGGFADPVALATTSGQPLRLYLLDADSDWDLDILGLWQENTADGVVSTVRLFNNNRDERSRGAVGSFTDIAQTCGFHRFEFPVGELAFADWDEDIDLDLLVLERETGRAQVFENERAWKFSRVESSEGTAGPELRAPVGTEQIISSDVDGDGREDLLLFGGDRSALWKNRGRLRFEVDEGFEASHGARSLSSAVAFDVLFDLENRLLVTERSSKEFAPLLIDGDAVRAGQVTPAGELADGEDVERASILLTAVDPSLRVQCIVADAVRGLRAYDLEHAAAQCIAVELAGPPPDRVLPEKERSNPAAIGATVELCVGDRRILRQLNTGSGGTARNATRFVCGLGTARLADYVRILWPDSILQSELSLVGGQLHRISETERKPSSCPVLFTWNGAEFEFVADFLGVGGLGYFEAPGKYNSPDPTEILHLPTVVPRVDDETGEAHWEFRVLEPLEECTYLDSARLVAVDCPESLGVLPNEMFAITGPVPDYELLAHGERLTPRQVTDQDGADVTASLARLDRDYGPRLERDHRFPGILRRLQWIDLEFGAALDELVGACDSKQGSRVFLFLHGYIEYGYSTTNFAASQASFVPRVPTFRVERDGEWVTLREDWGFPAGYPRWMAVDLGGLLAAGDRKLRIETNLEIGWDIAFLAEASSIDGLAVHELSADSAELAFRGFPLTPAPVDEVEGFRYADFERFDHFKAMPGRYTRFGDVRALLESDDDRFVVFGPGDEIRFRFACSRLPPVPAGHRREFFWKAGGYCKDMDLYTAHGEGVEPLPFRGMGPYDSVGERDTVADRQSYRAEWNTREVRGTVRTPVTDAQTAAGEPGDSR